MARAADARDVLTLTGAVLGGLAFVACGLWFAPGWANGWPLGLPRSAVWPAGLALVSFAAVLVAGGGAGGAARAAFGRPARLWPPTGWYGLWLLACVPVAAAAA